MRSRRRAGWPGLILGGACFIAPAVAIVLVLAWAYDRFHATPAGGGALDGIEPVVGLVRRSRWLAPALDGITVAALGLMAGVTIRLGDRAIPDGFTAAIPPSRPSAVLLRWRPNVAVLVAAGAAIGATRALL